MKVKEEMKKYKCPKCRIKKEYEEGVTQFLPEAYYDPSNNDDPEENPKPFIPPIKPRFPDDDEETIKER